MRPAIDPTESRVAIRFKVSRTTAVDMFDFAGRELTVRSKWAPSKSLKSCTRGGVHILTGPCCDLSFSRSLAKKMICPFPS